MHRRSFLGKGVAIGAGLALSTAARNDVGAEAVRPATAPAAGEPAKSAFPERLPGSRFTLSCAGYSFRSILPGRNRNPEMSLEDFIDFCAAQDLEGVELTSYFFPRTDTEFLVSLKRRAFLNGLTITGTPVGNNFCLPPGSERERQLALVHDWVERAAILGAPCIRVFAGSVPSGHSEDEARAWCIECLRQACEHAGARGVVLALENHGGIVSTAAQVLKILDGIESPWLGLNLDTGNFHGRGLDPYEEMDRVATHAVVVQLKVEVTDAEGKHHPTDIPRVLEILRRHGFRGVIALEYEAGEDPRTAVPRHLSELKRAVRGA